MPASAERRPPCPECGGDLPAGAHYRRKYCGPSCAENVRQRLDREKKRAAGAAGRGPRPPCPECGGAVPALPRGRRTFCGDACMMAHRRRVNAGRSRAARRVRRGSRPPCPICGGAVSPDAHGKRKYCGIECAYAARARASAAYVRRLALAERAARAPRPPCLECGGAIPPEAHGARKYCSLQCSGRAGNRRHRRHNAAARHRRAVDRRRELPPCPECGAAIPLETGGPRKYCSVVCSIRVDRRQRRERRQRRQEKILKGGAA